MADAVRDARAVEPEPEALHRPPARARGHQIERDDDGGFRVIGRQAERAVALSDLTNLEALDYAHARLRSWASTRRWPGPAPSEGDLVHIGGLTSTYDEDVTLVAWSSWPRSAPRRSPTTHGEIAVGAIDKLCAEVAARAGRRATGVVVVTSGAIGAGLPALGLGGDRRPRDPVTLQAVSAVGQSRLMQVYDDALGRPRARRRPGAARAARLRGPPPVPPGPGHACSPARAGRGARRQRERRHRRRRDPLRRQRPPRRARRPPGRCRTCWCCSPTRPGVLTADPRLDAGASLIEEIVEVDHELEALAGGAGSARGSGGMATKIAAAKIAAWSGVRTVIADADRPGVLPDAVAGVAGVGTVVLPHDRDLPARKLWIAFAVGSAGTVVVDDGARRALERGGIVAAAGRRGRGPGAFDADDAVEIAAPTAWSSPRAWSAASSAASWRPRRRPACAAVSCPTTASPRYLVHAERPVVASCPWSRPPSAGLGRLGGVPGWGEPRPSRLGARRGGRAGPDLGGGPGLDVHGRLLDLEHAALDLLALSSDMPLAWRSGSRSCPAPRRRSARPRRRSR